MTNMERFELGDAPKEQKYAAYRANVKWRKIYSFLSRGYWHVTLPENWEGIKSDGAIMPNTNGRFPSRFSGITEQSYGYRHECVHLFDFKTPTEEQVIESWGHACDILMDEVPTILLRLDRRRLRYRIIPNDAAELKDGIVPYCEVCYPFEIPISKIVAAYWVPPRSESLSEFKPEQLDMMKPVEPMERPEVDPVDWLDLTEEVRRKLYDPPASSE